VSKPIISSSKEYYSVFGRQETHISRNTLEVAGEPVNPREELSISPKTYSKSAGNKDSNARVRSRKYRPAKGVKDL
jgi:hypothetical protein